MKKIPNCIAVFSGGLDSTTLVYKLLEAGHNPHLVSFNYGQRHRKELDVARAMAYRLNLQHDIVDLTGITHLISNSALTSSITPSTMSTPVRYDTDVPEGHYAEDNMKKTVVPNRNMIMLSIAAGIAVNNNCEFIATGVHAGDHFVYPDCRPSFINAANAAIVRGNEGFGSIPQQIEGADLKDFIQAPFLHKSKADIAYEALRLGVPLEATWSCYKGGEKHCGKCGTCVERLEAIDDALDKYNGEVLRVESPFELAFDPTEYEDINFWRQAVASK